MARCGGSHLRVSFLFEPPLSLVVRVRVSSVHRCCVVDSFLRAALLNLPPEHGRSGSAWHVAQVVHTGLQRILTRSACPH